MTVFCSAMTKNSQNDTVFALSSAPGRGGVAVVRVTGPLALAGLRALAPHREFPARQAVFCTLYDGAKEIDQALVLYFKGPKSFSGEDTVEYHIHGGKAVVDALLRVLAKQDGHRPAEPGEFTRRAFENGKLDLTAAEGIADLINAETEAQREQALVQMGGALERLYSDWTKRLTRALAHQEADIEFPEDDMPAGITQAIVPELEKLRAEMAAHLDDNHRGERLREGVMIAIIGAPNAGKSSLLNALARRNVAIISPTAGTTRDVIEAHLDLAGYPVIVADTAGLRAATQDAIEIEGMARARQRAQEADLRLAIFDASIEPDAETLGFLNKDKDRTIAVWNKSDLRADLKADLAMPRHEGIAVSAQTGEGMAQLLDLMACKIRALYGDLNARTPTLSRPRHRHLVTGCRDHLTAALAAKLPELAAEDLRMGLRCLGRLTGHIGVEDMLDVIFRDFCIGK